jgi:phosphatidylinositol alpha-mannosyltransferase
VVGTGFLGYSYKSYLDKEVQKHVRWVGLIPSELRPRYLASCDVFCSPATGNESFGIVLLEAMATETPVVASDIPGYRSVMTEDEQGRFVPPCESGALAKAIVGLLKDAERSRRLGEGGRRRAAEFAWPKVAARVEQLYRRLMQEYQYPRYGRQGEGQSSPT